VENFKGAEEKTMLVLPPSASPVSPGQLKFRARAVIARERSLKGRTVNNDIDRSRDAKIRVLEITGEFLTGHLLNNGGLINLPGSVAPEGKRTCP
jgi:hypothetical protein